MNKDIDYNIIINRKNIKNLYIRVDDNLNVVVNANKKVKDKHIYDFLKKKEKWIYKRLNAIKEKTDITSLNDNYISILGDLYKIEVIKSDEDRIIIDEDNLFLLCISDDLYYQTNIINSFLKNVFVNILENKIIDECKKDVEKINIYKNFNLKVKLMKSRFGSYSLKTNTICLNLCLVKYNEEVIKSVLYHELCHMRYMNHQNEFYNILNKVCPKYGDYSKILKKDFVSSDTWFLT